MNTFLTLVAEKRREISSLANDASDGARFSLRRPARSQEANVEEKASARSVRKGSVGWVVRGTRVGTTKIKQKWAVNPVTCNNLSNLIS